ncbi:DeoR family transcriptional regulator [Clostridium polyendosporum]|uniref:DeoR family transcriptional regulator n=1 Tax=Clostridium polyendosporum TaxID=69208 RepID=A0A919RZI9_9CLOT|nr:DeoR/GlpR family DNA-binding transcription regulator [Clostridium polyendosporum]GIM28586.1 DeoR family transcriptional regulator [Clostridium polyendosporum]
MYQIERMQAIIDYLKNNKRISVEDICKLYGVSRDTARRDIVNLESKGLIVRTHGGAILPERHEDIKDYKVRLGTNIEEKRSIAALAALLVKDGDNVIMDTSTTVQITAENLKVSNCTVITNSINLADILSSKDGINIHLLGGQLNHEHRYLYGHSTIQMLSNYFADKAFVGALGITEKGLTVAYEEDAFVMRKMIEQANQVIVLIDHFKFGKNGYYKVADLDEIDLVVTDKAPDEKYVNLLKKKNIEIIYNK